MVVFASARFWFYSALTVGLMLLLLTFGVISLTTNLFTALCVSMIPVGAMLLFSRKETPVLGIGIMLAGLLGVLVGTTGAFPGLSVGEALNMGGSP